MAERKKVVADTCVVLQATLSPSGPSGSVFSLLDSGKIVLCLSHQLREEIEDVLRRPAIRQKNPQLTDERVDALLQHLDSQANLITLVRRYVDFPRDRDDEHILNLAIDVHADYLVTRDRDLLQLANDKDFNLIYSFLRIVDPVAFMREYGIGANE